MAKDTKKKLPAFLMKFKKGDKAVDKKSAKGKMKKCK